MSPSIAFVLLLRQSAVFILIAMFVVFAAWKWRTSASLRRRADELAEWLGR